jgi:hypothetical protein
MTIPINQETELEFCVQIVGADVADGNTILFEVRFDNGGSLDGYTNTPTVTIDKPSPVLVQSAFRIRSDDSQTINADAGWAADVNTDATIDCHHRFRLRIEVEETNSVNFTGTFDLRVSKNSGAYVDTGAYPSDPATALAGDTNVVWVTASGIVTDGSVTSNLLTGAGTSSRTFQAGEFSEDNATTSISNLNNEHTEYEFSIVIPTFWMVTDGTVEQNVDGDTFDFRVYQTDGTALDTYTNTPRITLNVPSGYIGGTYTETPDHHGPFVDGNNNLYWVQECEELFANIMMLKSTDNGATWAEIDGTNRPAQNDLESASIVQVGDILHIAHQPGDIYYHRFHMSGNGATPDTWNITDEVITTGTTQIDQSCSIAVFSGGDICALYGNDDGANERIRYKIRNGTWAGEQNLDATASTSFTGVTSVMGASNTLHVFYKDDTNGDIYHNTMDNTGSLGTRQQVESDAGTGQDYRVSLIPPVYYDDGGVEVIAIGFLDASDNLAYVRYLRDETLQTRAAASDNTVLKNAPSGPNSRQPHAFLANDGSTVYIMYASLSDNDVYRDLNVDEGGWGTDTEEQDAVKCTFIRGTVLTHGGGKVLAYIWEDTEDMGTVNTDGGFTGGTKYSEIALGAAVLPLFQEDILGRRLMKGVTL